MSKHKSKTHNPTPRVLLEKAGTRYKVILNEDDITNRLERRAAATQLRHAKQQKFG